MAKWFACKCPAAESVAASLRTLFALNLLYLLLFPCWINSFLLPVQCIALQSPHHTQNPSFLTSKSFHCLFVIQTKSSQAFYSSFAMCGLYLVFAWCSDFSYATFTLSLFPVFFRTSALPCVVAVFIVVAGYFVPLPENISHKSFSFREVAVSD